MGHYPIKHKGAKHGWRSLITGLDIVRDRENVEAYVFIC